LRRCAAHHQDQELITSEAGPGSRPASRAVQVRPPPRDRSIPSAETPVGGHAPAANQQADTDQREISEQAPHALLLPPPAHMRDRRQPGRSAPAATRKPTP
jgi:hypothetical protein